nr:hypothetical protein B0A51_06332 [Rachicladosporium sp. CCFEE 5018]
MPFCRVAFFLAFTHIAYSAQPSAPEPVAAPLRELPWAQLNFLHTTDTHGWHGGHLQEPQYSADWGDYISFAHHLRKRADDDGSDLLIVDTGDRVEGNGLYDGSHPKGLYTFDILGEQQVDIMTVGNHELYLKNASENEYHQTVPKFKNAYVSSNVDIQNPDSGELEPLAPRFRKFTTKNQGIRILAFGFLFNFRGNANNTFVENVKNTVEEKWFQDAIRSKDVDLFVVAGHVPVRDSLEYDLIYNTIRKAAWDTPIVFFGGHTHIRDYKKYDSQAYGIESGRYMETLGFLSIDGLKAGGKTSEFTAASSLKYQRLYIDNNLYSLHHHSSTNATTFPTEKGTNVSKAIAHARSKLALDHTFGCAPRDFWLNRAPYPANDSLLTWLENEVIPDTFSNATDMSIIITNSGAMRFDIFKGPFTTDTTYLVSPFTSGFRTIANVPYKVASQVLQVLNSEGPILQDFDIEAQKLMSLRPPLPRNAGLRPTGAIDGTNAQTPLSDSSRPTIPGYTTSDDAGRDGDDTVHAPIRFYDVPNCISAAVKFDPAGEDSLPETVDLVYNEFIQDWVLLALRYLGKKYEVAETKEALDGKTMTSVISEWVGEHWACEKDVGNWEL